MKKNIIKNTIGYDWGGPTLGKITISRIKSPYTTTNGKILGSEEVVSIGVSLNEKSKEPQWKIHIPDKYIDSVIESLKNIKNAK